MSDQQALDVFLDKFDPDIATQARAVLDRIREFVPGAVELVNDNYHALAISFGPTMRAGDAVLSVSVFPQWVTLYFMHGVDMRDPFGLLHGTNGPVRGVRIKELAQLDDERLQMLIEEAVATSPKPFDERAARRMVIMPVEEKRRSQR